MSISTHIDTWCKICGITRIDDAQSCAQAGADALGFNCYPDSPRYVDVDTVGQLSRATRLSSVALFVDATALQVKAVLDAAEIDILQFHGAEDEAFCSQFGVPYMKVLRMRPDLDASFEQRRFASAWAILLDTYVPGHPGGTGETFDWARWPQTDATRWVLAGGLTVANVASAIKQVKPFGVDVCGGVEGSVKGIKDHQKIMEFIQEVRSVRGK
jgi:phosphoribosylanthranilate isomerase